jgi:hypothetical protein
MASDWLIWSPFDRVSLVFEQAPDQDRWRPPTRPPQASGNEAVAICVSWEIILSTTASFTNTRRQMCYITLTASNKATIQLLADSKWIVVWISGPMKDMISFEFQKKLRSEEKPFWNQRNRWIQIIEYLENSKIFDWIQNDHKCDFSNHGDFIHKSIWLPFFWKWNHCKWLQEYSMDVSWRNLGVLMIITSH